jgi:DNA-binding cell septation regulator SpoVG
MNTATDVKNFMDKIKKMEKGHLLDLSSDEDLSIAIMNLISIEEHLFFTAQKTGKTKYLDVMHQAREMRKELLKTIIKDYEGEVWCTSKHLLSASMRLYEVGTKALTKGDRKKAQDLFDKSYNLYNLFWGINLGFVKDSKLKDLKENKQDQPLDLKKTDFFGKINNVVGKILDCCRE